MSAKRTALFLAVLLPACASAPDEVAAPGPGHGAELQSEADATAAASETQGGPVPSGASAPGGGASAGATALREARSPREGFVAPDWATLRDPAFRKRFAESYLAETEIEPTVEAEERKAMLAVIDLVAGEKLDEAAALIETNRGSGASATFDFALGQIHYQREQFDAAAAAYGAAVEKHPKFRRAWTKLAEVRYRQGEFGSAIRAFTRVLELGGGDAVSYGLLGVCHARSDDHVAAEAAFRLATMLDPSAMQWKTGLAESLFRQSRFTDAAALFGGLVVAHPDRAELWRFQGEALAMAEQPLEAIECFEMARNLGGATVDLLHNLGLLYARQGVHDMAVDSYLAALDLSPSGALEPALRTAKFLSSQGALDELGRFLDGIEARRRDIGLEERKDLLKLRARLAVARGAGDEEARVLEEIVRLDPLDGDALILLGRHAGRSGDAEKAVFWFERAAGLEAFEREAKLRHGELLVKAGQYAQALPFLRRAQAIESREDVQRFLEQVERLAQAR